MLADLGGTQAPQRLGLDLPGALARHPQHLAHLFQRTALAIGQAIAQVDDPALALVEVIEARGAEAVIPAQKNRKEQRAVDPHLYRERNVVERFWARAKQFRRVATRYEKKAANFLAFAWVAALVVMME